jgi:NAD(P)-dependent dehydrogenase (short-subunit alcohol dehydrogenase family)
VSSREVRRVVVVTGASSGVGRATALAFAARGDAVGLLARPAESLDAACEEVERAGGTALALPADVADAAAVERAASIAEERLGPLDVWVNCAMVSVFAPAWTYTAEEVDRTTAVTYLGGVHGTLAALRRMRPRDRGTIVQVGSALAYRSIALQAAYCGAKAALRAFTDSVRCDLQHEGSHVHITTVHLPAMNTPQFDQVRNRLPRRPRPVAPVYQPEVAGRAIVWASEHRRRELLVGYPTVQAILAAKLAPGLTDRYLARKGVGSQQTEEPDDPRRADNLETPFPSPLGVHGRFDGESHGHSLHLWATMHRRWLAGAGTGLGAATLAVRRRRGGRR